ncbi:sugar ABC transporter substrate-binding protein [Xenorhabdus sp. SGI246]|uniref:sugar ABC transporter substrate-binding protein n=1 Tax=Xenorhabdus sp. SGI246 TaxID=3158263 RepID=UPI00349F3F07
MKQIYYDEGFSGNNKYTFEVYQREDGTYLALSRRWNRKLNLVQDETQFEATTREALREQNYPRTRQVKIFLNSDFWSQQNEQS